MPSASNLPLRAREHTLAGLLKKGSFFVPRYQRQYSWTLDEVEELWDDVSEAASSGQPQFFGTVLTTTDATRDPGLLELLDGQQRLTTFALLQVVVHRHLAARLGPSAAPDVRESAARLTERLATCIWQSPGSDEGQRQPRLKLREGDSLLFEQIVNGDPGGDPRHRLVAAFNFLSERLDQALKAHPRPIQLLENLVTTLLDRGIIIHANAAPQFDAFVVFSTLNARGLPLDAYEILRARNLGRANQLNEDDVHRLTSETWHRIEAFSDDADDFLVAYLEMRKGMRVQRKKIVREFVAEFGQLYQVSSMGAETVARFADLQRELKSCLEIFGDLLGGRAPVDIEDAHPHVRYLIADLKLKQLLPLLMATAYRHHELFPEVLYDLERYSVIAQVALGNKTQWGNTLFEIAQMAYAGDFDIATMREKLRGFFVDELETEDLRAEVERRLKLGLVYNNRNVKLLRLFFILLEAYGYPERQPDYYDRPHLDKIPNLSRVNLDHIAARKGDHGVPASDLNRLGNLTPLDERCNKEAGVMSFKEKKAKCFAVSKWQVTAADLKAYDDWGLEQIEEREDRLVTWASKLLCRGLEV